MRLLSVLGASLALTDHLVRHPEQWTELTDPTLGSTRAAAYAVRAGLLDAVGADPLAPVPVATLPEREALDAMRVEYRRVLLRLAARDLAHHVGVDDVAAELVRPGRRRPGGRAGGRAGPGGRGRRDDPARCRRDGQVRRPRAELRLRRRRDLRVRTGRRR